MMCLRRLAAATVDSLAWLEDGGLREADLRRFEGSITPCFDGVSGVDRAAHIAVGEFIHLTTSYYF